MKRAVPGFVILLTVLGAAGRCLALPQGSAISGVVRDAHGTPQMGALVELLTADATTVVAAFTDDHGRYVIPAVMPGKYQVRATAAFFLPTMQRDLRLRPGVQAVINLTMNTLFEAVNWLPAETRRADEPSDDWKWTLRSTANRPLLRLIDPETGLEVSASGAEGRRSPSAEARVGVFSGDGEFGHGGMHQVFTMARSAEDRGTAVFRADLSDAASALPARPSTEITAGYEARSTLGRSTRLLTSFQSHPELASPLGAGFTVVKLASSQQIALGDAVLIDAGTLLEAERAVSSRMHAEPFVRVSVKPDENTVVGYRYATGRTLQGSQDLDRLKPALDVTVDENGRPVALTGSHHELSILRKLGTRTLTVAGFADATASSALTGSGTFTASRTGTPLPLLGDSSTGTFRVTARGVESRGISVAVAQPLTTALTASAQYDLGKALSASEGQQVLLSGLSSQLHSETTSAASMALRGKLVRTGTDLDAEYRWQPVRTLTQVNAYNTRADEAYLSFFVRQRLWCGRFLPDGVDAVVEATNLLEQGYQPVLAPDGHTLFLAQVPRGVQGGLAFNF